MKHILAWALNVVAVVMLVLAFGSITKTILVLGAELAAFVVAWNSMRISGPAGPLVSAAFAALMVGVTVAVAYGPAGRAVLFATSSAAVMGTATLILRDLRGKAQS